jgi:hypothetical protein
MAPVPTSGLDTTPQRGPEGGPIHGDTHHAERAGRGSRGLPAGALPKTAAGGRFRMPPLRRGRARLDLTKLPGASHRERAGA